MPVKELSKEVYTLVKSDFYSLKGWVKTIQFEDGKKKLTFNYDIQRSYYKGKDDQDKPIWVNQSLGLAKVSDVSYLRKIANILIATKSNREVHFGRYYAHKILTPSKADPSKKFLTTYEINREYFKKETEKWEKTQTTIFPCNDLVVFADFLSTCAREVHKILVDFESRLKNEFYGDSSIQEKNSSSGDEFVDERIDDDIPF